MGAALTAGEPITTRGGAEGPQGDRRSAALQRARAGCGRAHGHRRGSARGPAAGPQGAGRSVLRRRDRCRCWPSPGRRPWPWNSPSGDRPPSRSRVLEDRDRIARDLHDLAIQRLFATGMTLQSAAALRRPSRGDGAAAACRRRPRRDHQDHPVHDLRAAGQARPSADPRGLRSPGRGEVERGRARRSGSRPRCAWRACSTPTCRRRSSRTPWPCSAEALSNAARHARATAGRDLPRRRRRDAHRRGHGQRDRAPTGRSPQRPAQPRGARRAAGRSVRSGPRAGGRYPHGVAGAAHGRRIRIGAVPCRCQCGRPPAVSRTSLAGCRGVAGPSGP